MLVFDKVLLRDSLRVQEQVVVVKFLSKIN